MKEGVILFVYVLRKGINIECYRVFVTPRKDVNVWTMEIREKCQYICV